MRIRIIGCGWYGAHLGLSLSEAGHEVEIYETAPRIFAGASGSSPSRLHQGQHYPRSRLTRAACQEHHAEFMWVYGHLTRPIPINIYAVAAYESLVDFGTFSQVLRGEIEFITIKPEEFGLQNVEGAILTGERHILVDEARRYFQAKIGGLVRYNQPPGVVDDPHWDFSLDCSFCANDAEAIDRYEPCVMGLVEGPTDRSVTVMDGQFPSLYVWDESRNLSSLTSASLTPLSKTCRTYAEAKAIIDKASPAETTGRVTAMLDQMAHYWPEVRDRYRIVDERLSIRAMPRSGADARLVDVVRVGERALRVRAGKIDAIFHAERIIKEMIGE